RAKPESPSDLSTPQPKKTKTNRNGNGTSNTAGEEAEEDEEYRWWEETQNDGTVKWTNLEHNGVLFPPPYEPLPKHVKMKYDGKPVTLPPEAEEVAGFFAAMLETDHARNTVFQKNFFADWLDVLRKCNVAPHIKDFEKCDFKP